MQDYDAFVNALCNKWSLSALQSRDKAINMWTSLRISAVIDNPPVILQHDLDQCWQTESKRIWIQVDCKGVPEFLAGRAVLETNDLRPVFLKVARRVR